MGAALRISAPSPESSHSGKDGRRRSENGRSSEDVPVEPGVPSSAPGFCSVFGQNIELYVSNPLRRKAPQFDFFLMAEGTSALPHFSATTAFSASPFCSEVFSRVFPADFLCGCLRNIRQKLERPECLTVLSGRHVQTTHPLLYHKHLGDIFLSHLQRKNDGLNHAEDVSGVIKQNLNRVETREQSAGG